MKAVAAVIAVKVVSSVQKLACRIYVNGRAKDTYESMLPHIADTEELHNVIMEMIGEINALSDFYLSPNWTQAIVFGVLIGILVFKPTGLLGQQLADRA